MSNQRTSRFTLLITLLSLSVVLIFTACPPVQGPEPGNGGEQPKVTEAPTAEPTVAPTPVAEFVSAEGDVWVVPSEETVAADDTFTTNVHFHFTESNLSAYGIILTFDSEIILPGDVVAGASINSDGYLAAAAYKIEDGVHKVIASGFDVSGKQGSDMDIFYVNWKAVAAGTTEINVIIDNLTNTAANPISGQAHNTTITVTD